MNNIIWKVIGDESFKRIEHLAMPDGYPGFWRIGISRLGELLGRGRKRIK